MDSMEFDQQFRIEPRGHYWLTLFHGEREVTHLVWVDSVNDSGIYGNAAGFDSVAIDRAKIIRAISVRKAEHDSAVYGTPHHMSDEPPF